MYRVCARCIHVTGKLEEGEGRGEGGGERESEEEARDKEGEALPCVYTT